MNNSDPANLTFLFRKTVVASLTVISRTSSGSPTTRTETFALMNEAYEDEKLSRTQVYFWYKRFKEGRKSIADDSRSGRPLTSTSDRNIGQLKKIVGEHLNMKKLCGYFVPRNLTDQQRKNRLSIYKNLIETANNDLNF
ncbi:hypothetical protein LAZ67_23001181 [Cordylochernes scorpioides]|uniref:Mos1 transposase HTH domain-containing protein n=1 Tax=Cordylochernes scorpioides TaxID=51811 RepID=A0ABY6LT34_9ARAC|nr:hypothetical protein LAZ67_23001181 [Cordylochernes scorpioides]